MPGLSTHLARFLVAIAIAFVAGGAGAQDTFSLVAIDRERGEVVSAGASCLDDAVVPGGAAVVSTVLPSVGALHTQSYYAAGNQSRGRALMLAGLTARATVDSLVADDVALTPELRQYLAVDLGPAGTAAAAFTGAACAPYAGQYVSSDLVIAGNILLDSLVIARMRDAFRATQDRGGRLAECALAALQAVAYPGADRRCLDDGVSSRSAFLRLARPGDAPDDLTLDLVVPRAVEGRDPIDVLAERFGGS